MVVVPDFVFARNWHQLPPHRAKAEVAALLMTFPPTGFKELVPGGVYKDQQGGTFTDWITTRVELQRLTLRPNVPIVWTYCADGFCYWRPEQSRAIVNRLAGCPDVLVYPGMKTAADTARTMYAALWGMN